MAFLAVSGIMTLCIALFVAWVAIFEHNRTKQLDSEQ